MNTVLTIISQVLFVYAVLLILKEFTKLLDSIGRLIKIIKHK